MKFYVLEFNSEWKAGKTPDSPAHNLWSTAQEVERINGDSEKCPMCGRHVSMLSWQQPHKMRLIGKRYPDRLVDNLMQPLVVSDRFVEMFRREKLSGVSEFTQIEVVNTTDSPNYYLGHVLFNQSVQIDLLHTIVEGQPKEWSCPICNPWGTSKDKILKLALSTTNWDGQDIMRLYAFGTIVSERFYDCVRQYRLTNFVMSAVDKYQWP